MGRGKLPLRLIEKERARRITCTKRKKGLLKKAYELSTLCDIRVCVVIHDSDAADGNCLRTFPENPRDVQQIVQEYYVAKEKNPTNTKRDLTLVDFFNDRVRRLRSETQKFAHDQSLNNTNFGGFGVWDHRIDGFNKDQLFDLMARLDSKIEEVTRLKDDLQVQENKSSDDKSVMMISSHSTNSLGQGQAWLQNHGKILDQPSSSSNGNVFDHQMMMGFEASPWGVMNNLQYYDQLLDASDMCELGMGLESSSSPLPNGNSVSALQPYQTVTMPLMYGPSMQHFPGHGQFFHGSAPAYQLVSGNELVGVSQEELKFHGKLSHFGFGKPSGV